MALKEHLATPSGKPVTPLAASSEAEPARSADPRCYIVMKWCCYTIDYAVLIITFAAYNSFASGGKWSPIKAASIIPVSASALLCVDWLKVLLWGDLLAAAKVQHLRCLRRELLWLVTSWAGCRKIAAFLARVLAGEGITRQFLDKTEARRGVLFHFFFFAKMALVFVPFGSYLMTLLGLFSFEPLTRSIVVTVYLEYFFMAVVKDVLSMNVLHQAMHKHWYALHVVHHMPAKELSAVNVFYFDLLDVFAESMAAPILMVIMKMTTCSSCAGGMPSLHYLSFVLLLWTEIQDHAICPYTVGFFNPILDYLMKPNVSHHLHHALNADHYTVFPWHQLKGVSHYDSRQRASIDGSIERDFATYNRLFGTSFPA